MTRPTDEQLENPGIAGTQAAMAFQGPETNVRIGPSPKRFEWTGAPPKVKKDTPLIPPALTRGTLEMGGDPEQRAADHGLYWVRITHRHADGSPGAVVGAYGEIYHFGEERQIPGADAAALAQQKSAVFLFEGSTKAEVEFIEKARAMGYTVEAPRVRAEDRAEFQFLKKKKSGFVADALDPGLKKP